MSVTNTSSKKSAFVKNELTESDRPELTSEYTHLLDQEPFDEN